MRRICEVVSEREPTLIKPIDELNCWLLPSRHVISANEYGYYEANSDYPPLHCSFVRAHVLHAQITICQFVLHLDLPFWCHCACHWSGGGEAVFEFASFVGQTD